ncbi:MAG TPA: MBL fold metallo-hydrolase, partial [Egibacteraceae bacterium]|nr:MBL fold metallo-hydrolase [Egibacteraceae bacterium]
MSSHTYGGHVAPAGPAIARSAHHGGGASVEIRKFSVGPMNNNVYLLVDEGSGRALLVDAANDAERIVAEVDGLNLAGIITTHGHRDHWQALARVSQATGAPTYLHPGDAAMVPVRADHEIADAMRIEFGDAEVTLIHTPGHTQGSV